MTFTDYIYSLVQTLPSATQKAALQWNGDFLLSNDWLLMEGNFKLVAKSLNSKKYYHILINKHIFLRSHQSCKRNNERAPLYIFMKFLIVYCTEFLVNSVTWCKFVAFLLTDKLQPWFDTKIFGIKSVAYLQVFTIISRETGGVEK